MKHFDKSQNMKHHSPGAKKRKATTYKENTPGGKADGSETTGLSAKPVFF